jgi:hypothetical protein
VSPLKIKIPSKNMREKPTNTPIIHSVFHAYINEMHGSRSKIPSKKISTGSVARRDLIPALKGSRQHKQTDISLCFIRFSTAYYFVIQQCSWRDLLFVNNSVIMNSSPHPPFHTRVLKCGPQASP